MLLNQNKQKSYSISQVIDSRRRSVNLFSQVKRSNSLENAIIRQSSVPRTAIHASFEDKKDEIDDSFKVEKDTP